MLTGRELPEAWQFDLGRAEAYERHLVPTTYAPWADPLVDLVGLKRGERLLDLACGTGIVARRAAPRVGAGGRVVGLDVNEAMLEVARAAVSGIRPPIEWRRGDSTHLPFPDGSFDVVVCQQALQCFPDPPAALRESFRVLAAQGRLGLGVWRSIEHHPAYVCLAEVLGRLVGAGPAAIARAPFPAWDREALRHLVMGAGFHGVHIRFGIGARRYPSAEAFLYQEAAGSPLAEAVGALSASARQALIHDLAQALQAHTDDDGVTFPIQCCLLVAYRA